VDDITCKGIADNTTNCIKIVRFNKNNITLVLLIMQRLARSASQSLYNLIMLEFPENRSLPIAPDIRRILLTFIDNVH